MVTGASSGIGRAIAEALAEAGASVVLLGRRTSALSEVQAGIAARGGRSAWLSADLADRQEAVGLADRCAEIFGEPDILVNAAAINLRPPLGSVTLEDWDATMGVNLTAPFVLGQRFGPSMADRGYGRIINIGSQQSFRAFGNSGAYGVSKAGIVALTRSQAEACGRSWLRPHSDDRSSLFRSRPGSRARRAHHGRAKWASRRLSWRSGFLGERSIGIRDRSGYLCGRWVFVDLIESSCTLVLARGDFTGWPPWTGWPQRSKCG